VLLAVNGENITSHEDGGAALKAAVGPLKLSVSASAAAPPTAASQPPLSGGAATKSARKSMGAMASAALSKIGSIANETPGMSAKESVLSTVGSTANETPDGQSPSDIPRAAAPVATATPIAPNQPRVRAAAPNLGREPEDSGAAEPPKPAFREAQAEKRRQAIKDAQPLKEKEECDLLEAAARGDEASVLLLLNSNTGIDIRGPTGWTALMAACYANRLAVAKILLGRGAALDATSKRGLTAFDLARERKHTEVVGLLKEVAKQRGVVLQSARPTEALWRAAEAGRANEVKQILIDHKRAQVDARMPETGKTALHVACALGHVEAASTLLDHEAKLETMAANGDTPLLLASVSGHLSVVKVLLGNGAKVDHKNKQGYQALDLAQKAGHQKVVLCLEDAQEAAAPVAPRVFDAKQTGLPPSHHALLLAAKETHAVNQLRAQLLLTNDKLDLSALRSATVVVASKKGQTDDVKEARARHEDVMKRRHVAASKMRNCSSQPFAYTDDGLLHRLIGEARSIGVDATEVKTAEERLHFLLEIRKVEAKTLQRVDERLRKLKASPHGQEAQLQQMVDMAAEETKQTVQDRLNELQSKIDNHPNTDDPLFRELLKDYKEQEALKGRLDKALNDAKVREFYSLCSETMKSNFASSRMLLRNMDNKTNAIDLLGIKKTDERSKAKAGFGKHMDSPMAAVEFGQGVVNAVQSSPAGGVILESALARGGDAFQALLEIAPDLADGIPGARMAIKMMCGTLVKAMKRRKAGQLMADMRHVTALAANFPASLPGGGYEALCEQAALQIAEDLKDVIMAKRDKAAFADMGMREVMGESMRTVEEVNCSGCCGTKSMPKQVMEAADKVSEYKRNVEVKVYGDIEASTELRKLAMDCAETMMNTIMDGPKGWGKTPNALREVAKHLAKTAAIEHGATRQLAAPQAVAVTVAPQAASVAVVPQAAAVAAAPQAASVAAAPRAASAVAARAVRQDNRPGRMSVSSPETESPPASPPTPAPPPLASETAKRTAPAKAAKAEAAKQTKVETPAVAKEAAAAAKAEKPAADKAAGSPAAGRIAFARKGNAAKAARDEAAAIDASIAQVGSSSRSSGQYGSMELESTGRAQAGTSEVEMAESAPVPLMITVTFEEGPLGVTLGDRDGVVKVVSVDARTVAEAKGVVAELVVREVSGKSAKGLDKAGVIALVKAASRPLTIKFERTQVGTSEVEMAEAPVAEAPAGFLSGVLAAAGIN